jgi:hypothetical protein
MPDNITYTYQIQGGQTTIQFNAKPPQPIREMLRAAGFRWSRAGHWWRRGYQGAADFLAALDRRMNPGRPDGPCWECGAPEGFFRPQGAATPVYCDACHAKHQPQEDPMGVDRAYEDSCRDACGL